MSKQLSNNGSKTCQRKLMKICLELSCKISNNLKLVKVKHFFERDERRASVYYSRWQFLSIHWLQEDISFRVFKVFLHNCTFSSADIYLFWPHTVHRTNRGTLETFLKCQSALRNSFSKPNMITMSLLVCKSLGS